VICRLGIIANAVYFGPQEEGLKYLQPFIGLKPILTRTQMVSWTNITSSSYFGFDKGACVKGQYVNPYTVGAKQTDVATLSSFTNDLLNFQIQNPDVSVNFVTHRFPNQAVLAVPDFATAYPNRDLQTHLYAPRLLPKLI